MNTKSTHFQFFTYQLLPVGRFIQGNIAGVGTIDELISSKK
jgi:hypothetical protein